MQRDAPGQVQTLALWLPHFCGFPAFERPIVLARLYASRKSKEGLLTSAAGQRRTQEQGRAEKLNGVRPSLLGGGDGIDGIDGPALEIPFLPRILIITLD